MTATHKQPPKTVGQSGRELWQTLTNEFELMMGYLRHCSCKSAYALTGWPRSASAFRARGL
jgi:hypothetical protein